LTFRFLRNEYARLPGSCHEALCPTQRIAIHALLSDLQCAMGAGAGTIVSSPTPSSACLQPWRVQPGESFVQWATFRGEPLSNARSDHSNVWGAPGRARNHLNGVHEAETASSGLRHALHDQPRRPAHLVRPKLRSKNRLELLDEFVALRCESLPFKPPFLE
jgi:hypothetical protein